MFSFIYENYNNYTYYENSLFQVENYDSLITKIRLKYCKFIIKFKIFFKNDF